MSPINYEEDPLKHYVRVNAWLPLCRRRKNALTGRRLRYFTFCAVNAVDVYMLEIARVIRRSSADKFDTVFFFDKTPEDVDNILDRIPGAVGFAGNFVDVVLAGDLGDEPDPLEPPADLENTEATRQRQRLAQTRRSFIESFPFDVINLDLEEFIFKQRDPFPGRVINALRNVFQWQRRALKPGHAASRLDGFTLMFTTQAGPPVLTPEYASMLADNITSNLQADATLTGLLQARAGTNDVTVLRNAHTLGAFFEIGVPKVLLGILHENDWYVDPERGIRVFRFTRPSNDGPYDILHFTMDVCRQEPSIENRAPGSAATAVALAAYIEVARGLVGAGPIVVTDDMAVLAELRPTLEQIRSRQRRLVGDL